MSFLQGHIGDDVAARDSQLFFIFITGRRIKPPMMEEVLYYFRVSKIYIYNNVYRFVCIMRLRRKKRGKHCNKLVETEGTGEEKENNCLFYWFREGLCCVRLGRPREVICLFEEQRGDCERGVQGDVGD